MTTKLGKITKVTLGTGGYQEAQFGFSFEIEYGIYTTGDFWGTWSERSESAKYSMYEWREHWIEAMLRIKKIMGEAKVQEFSELIGIPVDITFDGERMTGWRILTEAL